MRVISFRSPHQFIDNSQYEVVTRQVVPPKAVSTADDIYNYALPIMAKLERDIPGMKLRLMGLRCTNLVSTKKRGIDFFGTGEISKPESRPNPSSKNAGIEEGEDEWEVWPEEEFEEAARHEREDEMNEIEQLSQELQDLDSSKPAVAISPIRSKHKALDNLNATETPRQQQPWSCPICGRSQPGNDKTFNAHIDYCLSRQTIKEAARAASPAPPPLPPSTTTTTSSTSPTIPPPSLRSESKTPRGRGRPKKRKFGEGENEGKKQQLLFGR